MIYEVPVDFIRDITIPPPEDEQWNKSRAVLSTLLSPITFVFIVNYIDQQLFGISLVYLTLGLGVAGAALVWKFSESQRPPAFMWVFSLMAFIVSVGYISQIA